ncbi:MAG: lipoprotein signal peptidase [Tenuifilaceae bacterium]|nr:lipoprotein signal peptidase [Bacteroidales bacterium]MDI9517633.1 lipoprotein signal peptidase [Bacteroidota bacterium]NLH57223.1 lipoprotein signal peptidase [Rikenellaceae bacterium]OQC65088.1 MAG: lipoprotein signal peptidase [Bacteroidetes bacterium ADurb.Bin008]HNV80579.1 lipoprotein signal peptidase [Tenuifilaceae bacterium]
MHKISLRYRVALLIVLLLIADQVLKIWVKTHMVLGEQHHILGNWFIIHFTENPGMAFGMEFWGGNGKLILSLFRIIASGLICVYISWLIKKGAPVGVVLGMSLILVGALGNVIDSAFYGLIFGESYYEPATFFPQGGGYAGFLHGRVVDMLYFPIIQTTWPSWIPKIGGQPFIFFRPVFNIADSAITIGVFYLLIFQRKFLFEKTS